MSKPSLTLVPLDLNNDGELQDFLNILLESYSKVPFPPTLEGLKDPNKELFWAMRDGERIGTTGFSKKTPQLVESIKTVVDKKFQGQGLGKILSQKIEDHCKEIGIKKVVSTIYADNHKMIAIKMAQGYTIEGFHPDHEAPGWDEYSLGKILKE